MKCIITIFFLTLLFELILDNKQTSFTNFCFDFISKYTNIILYGNIKIRDVCRSTTEYF